MKTLLVLRHAKAVRPAPHLSDHDRGLVDRGESDAELVGRFLTLARVLPDAVLSSTAQRARSTFLAAARAGSWKCPVRYATEVYDGGVPETLAEVARTDDDVEVLLFVGHEPTVSQLVQLLAGQARLAFSTCTLVRIDCEAERWKDLRPGCGQLAWLLPPKLFRGGDFDFRVG